MKVLGGSSGAWKVLGRLKFHFSGVVGGCRGGREELSFALAARDLGGDPHIQRASELTIVLLFRFLFLCFCLLFENIPWLGRRSVGGRKDNKASAGPVGEGLPQGYSWSAWAPPRPGFQPC